MLYRQIQHKENDLIAINEMIADNADELEAHQKRRSM